MDIDRCDRELGNRVHYVRLKMENDTMTFDEAYQLVGDFIGSEGFIDVVFLGILAIPVAICMWFFNDRCPKCKKRLALESTGKEQEGRRWYQNPKHESKCKYCGHCVWYTDGSLGE